jgi:lipopolysaccharide export system protein LptA
MCSGLALLGVSAGALPALGAAQTPAAAAAAAGDNNQPIQIQADSGIEWQQSAHVYIARGNAVAIRGQSEVHADTLIAHYRDVKGSAGNTNTGGNTEIYRVEAEGHVTLKRDTQTVVGDRADYDVDKAIAVVTGKNLKLTTATDTVTARDSLEWFDQKQIAVARGDAVAIRNGKTIKADTLTAYMVKTAPAAKPGATAAKPPAKQAKPGGSAAPAAAAAATPASATTGAAAPGNSLVLPTASSNKAKTSLGVPGAAAPGAESKISRVDAQGHVVVTNGPDTGRGDFGVYNAETGIATLIRNVVIERGKDVIRGQRGVMDLNNNVSRMMPGGAPDVPHQRVQGLFMREDHGKAGAGAEAAPAAGKKP